MLTSKCFLMAMGVFALTLSLHAEVALSETVQDSGPAATQASAQGQDEDCFTVGDIQNREACFAKQSDDDIATCERMKPSACRPYKEMYVANHRLQSLNTELLTLARKKYASYTKDDASYLTDLARNAQASDRTWRAYRDAECSLEPFIQGMSRDQSSNLTEACRVTKTKARMAELNDLISTLK